MDLVRQMREQLSYDPEKGVIKWTSPGPGRKEDLVAGSIKTSNKGYVYRRIKFNGAEYTASKVAWILHSGEVPDFIIDHIDNDSLNIKWENLRRGDNFISHRNSKHNSVPISGHTGVLWRKGGWEVYIGQGKGKSNYIGRRKDLGEAISLRQDAEKELMYTH